MEMPEVMMAITRTGIVLPLDPGSNVNNAHSHNPESASKSLELKISAFTVAEIIILRQECNTDHNSLKCGACRRSGHVKKCEFDH
jgi:hypothetical protein